MEKKYREEKKFQISDNSRNQSKQDNSFTTSSVGVLSKWMQLNVILKTNSTKFKTVWPKSYLWRRSYESRRKDKTREYSERKQTPNYSLQRPTFITLGALNHYFDSLWISTIMTSNSVEQTTCYVNRLNKHLEESRTIAVRGFWL